MKRIELILKAKLIVTVLEGVIGTNEVEAAILRAETAANADGRQRLHLEAPSLGEVCDATMPR